MPIRCGLTDDEIELAALAAHLHRDGCSWRIVAETLNLYDASQARYLAAIFRLLCDLTRSDGAGDALTRDDERGRAMSERGGCVKG